MQKHATYVVILLAVIHVIILLAEMFAWSTMGPRLLGADDPEFLSKTAPMAANQGLYNGFLAAGLIWSLVTSDPVWKKRLALFFVGCIAVAGLYGGFSVRWTIHIAQTIPAFIGLYLIMFAKPAGDH